MVARALEVVESLTERGLLTFDGETAQLTAEGRMLSNDVFQEFLESASADLTVVSAVKRAATQCADY